MTHRLTAIPMSSYDTPVRAPPPHLGVRVDLGGENGTNGKLVLTFLFDFYNVSLMQCQRHLQISPVKKGNVFKAAWLFCLAPPYGGLLVSSVDCV